jgi:hypothetical protein
MSWKFSFEPEYSGAAIHRFERGVIELLVCNPGRHSVKNKQKAPGAPGLLAFDV